MSEVDPSALRPKPAPELIAERPTAMPIGRPAQHRPWRAVRSGAAVVLAAGLVAAVAFSWWDRTTIHSGGPVSLDSGILGQRLAVGEPTSFGGVMITNGSEKAATIEKIRIVGVTGDFDVLGVRTNPWPTSPGSETPAAPATRQPPTSAVVLEGSAVIPPVNSETLAGQSEQRIQLRIDARAGRPGVARARGIEISYRIGHRRYRRSYDASMYLCAPLKDFTPETCPGESEGRFDPASIDITIPPGGRSG